MRKKSTSQINEVGTSDVNGISDVEKVCDCMKCSS